MIWVVSSCCFQITRFHVLHAVFSCCSWTTTLLVLCVFDSNHLFSFFTHSAEADCEKWFLWNSFTSSEVFFLIIMYSFHVYCSYSSHLIRSSNHMNFMFHFMLLIKSTKYESCSFSTIMSCDDSICLLIESFFKNHNKLTWNIEWIFISDDNSSSYA